MSRQVTGWGAPWRDGDLTLREQGGAFADFRGGERALGFARSNLVSCAGWAGEEGRGGREPLGKLGWQVMREWPEMTPWKGEEAGRDREQRTGRTCSGWWRQRLRQRCPPQSEGLRRRHRFGYNDSFSYAHAEFEMGKVFMNTTTPLALNVQVSNSEGRRGVGTDVGAAGVNVGEIAEGRR